MNDGTTVEAELVQDKSLAVREEQKVINPLDLEPAMFKAGLDRRKENRKHLIAWVREALVEGTDFGRIPTKRGPSKPSLWKPGAEKICGMLGVTPTFPNLPEYEKACLSGTTLKQIMLRCEIINSSGGVIAHGVGCRSMEQDYGDLNKCIKMAEKSAHIDATLRMAGLSEIFTQDIEDMPSVQEPPTPAPPTNQKPKAEPHPKDATSRDRLIALIGANLKEKATQFLIELGWIMPNEGLQDLPLRWVPDTKKEAEAFINCLAQFCDDGKIIKPYDHQGELEKEKKIEVPRENVDKPGDQDVWRTFPMPFGKNAGIKLEELEKNYLFGLWANFTVETEYKGKPKKPETIAKDQTFRAMLDLAGAHYGFQKKD